MYLTVLLLGVILLAIGASGISICDVISAQTLKVLVKLPNRLHLVVSNDAYSVPLPDTPLTSLTIGDSSGYFGAWHVLPWLAPFHQMMPSVSSIVQGTLFFSPADSSPLFTLVWYYSGRTPIQCSYPLTVRDSWSKSDCLQVTSLGDYKQGLLSTGSANHSYLLGQVWNISATTWNARGVLLDPSTDSVGSSADLRFGRTLLVEAHTAISGKMTVIVTAKDNPDLKPDNKTRDSVPKFGFIHKGQIHLWATHSKTVWILPDPYGDALLKTDGGQAVELTNVTVVPFAKYFVCPPGQSPQKAVPGPEDGAPTRTQDTPDFTSTFYAIVIIILVLLGTFGLAYCMTPKTAKLGNNWQGRPSLGIRTRIPHFRAGFSEKAKEKQREKQRKKSKERKRKAKAAQKKKKRSKRRVPESSLSSSGSSSSLSDSGSSSSSNR